MFTGACALAGNVYAVAGSANTFKVTAAVSSCEMFSPDSGAWTFFDPLPSPRDSVAAVACIGNIYALGGNVYDDIPNNKTTVLADVYSYGTGSGGGGGGGTPPVPEIIIVPNPVKIGAKGQSKNAPIQVVFAKLPLNVTGTADIYTLTNKLVKTLNYTGSGKLLWDALDKDGSGLIPGVYFCVIQTSDGQKIKTKFSVIK